MRQEQSPLEHASESLVWSAGVTRDVVFATAAPVVENVLIPLLRRQMRKIRMNGRRRMR